MGFVRSTSISANNNSANNNSRLSISLLRSVSTLVVLVSGAYAVAQSTMDPSSALLLNPGARAAGRSSDKSDSSTRYTVRPRTSVERTEKPEKIEKATGKRVVEPAPTPVILPATEDGAVVIVHDSQPVAEPVVERKTEVSDSHILELGIATAYLYENAESAYSYRSSTMGGPAYAANAKAWLSSEFGIGGEYHSTLGGQVNDRGSAQAASRAQSGYGIFLRKIFSSANLVFGVEWVDSEFKVANETVSKLRTKSSGVRVGVKSEFLNATNSSWSLGFWAMPKIQHTETAAATDVRSGTSVSAYAVGASVMRRWNFDHSNSVFVNIEHKLERDLFSGAASGVDPIGQATPNGVSVTVGTTLIQFGYSWAD